MTREDERADTLSGPGCDCARAMVIPSTHRNGQDAVDQAWKRRVVQTRISWQACLMSFVSNVTSAFDSRISHRKVATCARGGVFKFRHVVTNDTIMHAVHTCTVAFSTQFWSIVVSVLSFTDCARFRNGSRNKNHCILWHTVTNVSSRERPEWKHARTESLRQSESERGKEFKLERSAVDVPEEHGSKDDEQVAVRHADASGGYITEKQARREKNERHPGQQKRIRSSNWRTIGQIEEESTIWARSSWMHQHLPIHLLHWSILPSGETSSQPGSVIVQKSGHVDDDVQSSALDPFFEMDGRKSRYIGEKCWSGIEEKMLEMSGEVNQMNWLRIGMSHRSQKQNLEHKSEDFWWMRIVEKLGKVTRRSWWMKNWFRTSWWMKKWSKRRDGWRIGSERRDGWRIGSERVIGGKILKNFVMNAKKWSAGCDGSVHIQNWCMGHILQRYKETCCRSQRSTCEAKFHPSTSISFWLMLITFHQNVKLSGSSVCSVRNSSPDAVSNSQVVLEDAYFGGLMDRVAGKPAATDNGNFSESESWSNHEKDAPSDTQFCVVLAHLEKKCALWHVHGNCDSRVWACLLEFCDSCSRILDRPFQFTDRRFAAQYIFPYFLHIQPCLATRGIMARASF